MTHTMVRNLILFALVLLFVSCSTDFDLTTGGEEKTVVYGLLSEQDFEHLIRVEKMFVDENIPPRELAQEESEVYHDNITVTLSKVGGRTFPLTRIDAADRGLERDSGLMITNPNYLYQIPQSRINLSSGDSVILRVEREDEILAEAGASIVGPSTISQPNVDVPVGILPNRSLTINWDDADNAIFYDVVLRFEITEREDGEDNTIFLEWIAATGLDESIYRLSGERMYNFLEAELEARPTIIRRLERIDIEISSGGRALKTFLDISRLNTGITSSQVQPDYSNVTFGLGLFSSRRSSVTPGFIVSQKTIDSLQTNSSTENLNFR